MLRPVQRSLVLVMVTVGLVSASAAMSAFALAGSRDSKPRLSERQVVRIARRAAARAGERTPTLIQHSAGTRQHANMVASGDRVPGNRWSYLLAECGSFVLKDASVPPGAAAPRGTVLTIVVDAATGTPTDVGVSNRYPDLGALGAVSTDRRQSSPHVGASSWLPRR